MSLGQSGFGTADAYMRFLNFAIHYSTDLVLLAFLTGNDFRNNSKILNKEKVAFNFDFDENGDLILDRSAFHKYQKSLAIQQNLWVTSGSGRAPSV